MSSKHKRSPSPEESQVRRVRSRTEPISGKQSRLPNDAVPPSNVPSGPKQCPAPVPFYVRRPGDKSMPPTTRAAVPAGSAGHAIRANKTSNTLYVGGLREHVDSEGLLRAFANFVPLNCWIIRNPSGMSKGYGFLKFMNHQLAKLVRDSMAGRDLDGQKLRIGFARGYEHQQTTPAVFAVRPTFEVPSDAQRREEQGDADSIILNEGVIRATIDLPLSAEPKPANPEPHDLGGKIVVEQEQGTEVQEEEGQSVDLLAQREAVINAPPQPRAPKKSSLKQQRREALQAVLDKLPSEFGRRKTDKQVLDKAKQIVSGSKTPVIDCLIGKRPSLYRKESVLPLAKRMLINIESRSAQWLLFASGITTERDCEYMQFFKLLHQIWSDEAFPAEIEARKAKLEAFMMRYIKPIRQHFPELANVRLK